MNNEVTGAVFCCKRAGIFCEFCNHLGDCTLISKCGYLEPQYYTTSTSGEWQYIKAPDVLPEVLIINGERYIKEHKI